MTVRYNLIVVGGGAFICVSDPSIVAAVFRTGVSPLKPPPVPSLTSSSMPKNTPTPSRPP
jgi:hypothetical protein